MFTVGRRATQAEYALQNFNCWVPPSTEPRPATVLRRNATTEERVLHALRARAAEERRRG